MHTLSSQRQDEEVVGDRVRLSRSPHPYHRRGDSLTGNRIVRSSSTGRSTASAASAASTAPTSTTPFSDSTESGTEADDEKDFGLKRLPAPPPRLRKGLRGSTPPNTLTPTRSPLPTPPALIQQELTGFFETIKPQQQQQQQQQHHQHHQQQQQQQQHQHQNQNQNQAKHRTRSEDRRRTREYIQRKTREIVRRSAEAGLLAAITALTICSARPAVLHPWSLELVVGLCLPVLMYLAYPVRKSMLAYVSGSSPLKAAWLGFHVPSRFDPGPLLYPVVLPVIIAVSLLHDRAAYLPINLACALSSMPERVTAIWHRPALLWYIRWIVTVLPLHMPRIRLLRSFWTPVGLKWVDETVSVEDCVLIFPLHQSLKTILAFLTTTSLDQCELELLTTALINLLLFARSPQAHVLRAVIWVGGMSLLITCRDLLAWEVALARIPKWRFAKQPQAGSLSERFKRAIQGFMNPQTRRAPDSSDDEVDERVSARPRLRLRPLTTFNAAHGHGLGSGLGLGHGPVSAVPAVEANGSTLSYVRQERDVLEVRQERRRRNTFSATDLKTEIVQVSSEIRGLRTRLFPSSQLPSSFLSLTAQQAAVRKYVYAGMAYLIIACVLFGPVWYYVATRALSGAEPVGWALGYAFGNIPYVREMVYDWKLDGWIKLPEMDFFSSSSSSTTTATTITAAAMIKLLSYPANIRLLITGYCLTILAIGIAIVLSLTVYVEVDTRRKVFHGVMVAMLLPTIFLDPCFLSLALAIILALFLLLDLVRASQLPPLSRPLTNFLAPFTDGRDHCGPVIVSHIFLLIGCAIPLWLALAGLPRNYSDPPPWVGWELVPTVVTSPTTDTGASTTAGGGGGGPVQVPEFRHRDLSMVAGVICVGMGDAAASLIGRRFGRTRWFWGGGKSLEGSLAFALAVTVGLMASFFWLRAGYYSSSLTSASSTLASTSPPLTGPGTSPGAGGLGMDPSLVLRTLSKCILAGCGASLLESVLTAANDNVVVPVVLWLIVRGLKV